MPAEPSVAPESVTQVVQVIDAPRALPLPGLDPSSGAVFAVGLGLLSFVGWMLPILGIPMTVTGLVLGWRALAARRRLAIFGMSLCAAFLALALVNATADTYVAVTGRPLYNTQTLKALLKK